MLLLLLTMMLLLVPIAIGLSGSINAEGSRGDDSGRAAGINGAAMADQPGSGKSTANFARHMVNTFNALRRAEGAADMALVVRCYLC